MSLKSFKVDFRGNYWITSVESYGVVPAAIAILAVSCLYTWVTITYNLFFHPLRKYPGPKSAASSRLPITWVTIQGRAPRWIKALHDKYGPVVRVAPDELSFIQAQAWKDIYTTSSYAKYGMERDQEYFDCFFDQNSIGTSILSASDEEHRRQRRAFIQVFHRSALAAQEPLIREHVKQIVPTLGKNINNVVDLHEIFACVIFDIIADLLFGEWLNLLEDTTHRKWAHALPGYARGFTYLAAFSKFTAFKTMLKLIVPAIPVSRYSWFIRSTKEKLAQRLDSTTRRKDAIYFFQNADPKSRLSRRELDGAVLAILIAGGTSTPELLTGMVYLLLKNPETLQKLVHEVRTSFDSASHIDMKNVGSLEYLSACIEESLRIYPPATSGLPRVVPKGGAMVAGNWVPEKTVVYVSPLPAYGAANFSKADSFEPTRWLAGAENSFKEDEKTALQPFNMGPRDCVGKPMAYLMIRLVICNLLWHFDLQPCDEENDWIKDQKIYTAWAVPPLNVTLTPVSSPETGLSEIPGA